ncbi:MAG: hypothetical protein HY015_07110 [Bacteroidetes bacterium]|nr:hypothetical protein [Bacteroidota bacterium]MBI3482732.1 hypothetical protein [Bacteroidota bacterium]
MKEVTLLVEDEKVDVFLKFVKTLDYVKVLDDGSFEELQGNLDEAKSVQSENLLKKPLKKFLNRL